MRKKFISGVAQGRGTLSVNCNGDGSGLPVMHAFRLPPGRVFFVPGQTQQLLTKRGVEGIDLGGGLGGGLAGHGGLLPVSRRRARGGRASRGGSAAWGTR